MIAPPTVKQVWSTWALANMQGTLTSAVGIAGFLAATANLDFHLWTADLDPGPFTTRPDILIPEVAQWSTYATKNITSWGGLDTTVDGKIRFAAGQVCSWTGADPMDPLTVRGYCVVDAVGFLLCTWVFQAPVGIVNATDVLVVVPEISLPVWSGQNA